MLPKELITGVLVIILLCPLIVSALEGKIGLDLIPETPINYSTVYVNSSDYADIWVTDVGNLDNPSDIEYSEVGGDSWWDSNVNLGSHTLNTTRVQTNKWYSSDGATALMEWVLGKIEVYENIDLNANDLTISGLLTDGVNALTIGEIQDAYDHMSSTGASHTYINQPVTISSSPTFSTPTVTSMNYDFQFSDYSIKNRGGYFYCLQEQNSGVQPSFELYSKDGDGTDNANYIMWGKGTPLSITNSEAMQFGYIAGGSPYYKVNTLALGTGTVRPVYFYTGANTGMQLLANGDVLFPDVYSDTVGSTNRDLYIDNTGKIGYVSSSINYKENIRNLTGTERIYNLHPVMFDRIDGSAKNETGLIAEEVLEVYPEKVSYKQIPIYDYRDIGIKDDKNKTIYELYIREWQETDEPETVLYSSFITDLITELQKQNTRINDLETRVNKLENGK